MTAEPAGPTNLSQSGRAWRQLRGYLVPCTRTITAALAAASSALRSAACQQAKGASKRSGGGRQRLRSPTAAGDINGTWKADINSVQFDTKPDDYLLQAGTYSCKSCTPAYSVPADGAFHPAEPALRRQRRR